MESYEVTYILETEAANQLSELAKRYYKINGWREREILQFAIVATAKGDIEIKLKFLESIIEQLEKESSFKIERQIYSGNKEQKKEHIMHRRKVLWQILRNMKDFLWK